MNGSTTKLIRKMYKSLTGDMMPAFRPLYNRPNQAKSDKGTWRIFKKRYKELTKKLGAI